MNYFLSGSITESTLQTHSSPDVNTLRDHILFAEVHVVTLRLQWFVIL